MPVPIDRLPDQALGRMPLSDLDVVVANFGAPNQLLTNDGHGFFADFTATDLPGGSQQSTDIALGDVDNDGDLDALVLNVNQPNQVLLNDGTGLSSATNLPGAPHQSTDIALGDLNGDGFLDAFVANVNQPNQVLLNDGTGSFNPIDLPIAPHQSTAIALGDVDGDGDLDALVANFGAPNQLLINRDGLGNFAPPKSLRGVSSKR